MKFEAPKMTLTLLWQSLSYRALNMTLDIIICC